MDWSNIFRSSEYSVRTDSVILSWICGVNRASQSEGLVSKSQLHKIPRSILWIFVIPHFFKISVALLDQAEIVPSRGTVRTDFGGRLHSVLFGQFIILHTCNVSAAEGDLTASKMYTKCAPIFLSSGSDLCNSRVSRLTRNAENADCPEIVRTKRRTRGKI